MADIKLNFSSQWPTIQVAKVVANPHNAGEADTYPYIRKIPHGLGYPPLAIGLGPSNGAASYNIMDGLDVDENYVYIRDYAGIMQPNLECAVIYALDISKAYDYAEYTSQIGEVIQDENTAVDLRKFLLHSRAVGPMVLNISTKDYENTVEGMVLRYQSPLNYPTFQFGYIRCAITVGVLRTGVWKNAPLASQAWPWLSSNGFLSRLTSTTIDGQLAGDKGSIITLRNPAIITENTTTVTL